MVSRTKTLTIIGMIILNIPTQVYAAWRLPSLNFANRLSRTQLMYVGVAATMCYGIHYWRNKKSVWQNLADHCKVHIAQARSLKQDLTTILQPYPNCTIKPFIAGQLNDTDFQGLQGIPFAHRLESKNGNPDNTGFILYQDQTLAGFILYDHASYDPILKNTPCYGQAEIMILGIRASHQGRGLGSLLMKYVMRVIENNGYEHIKLTADAQFNKRPKDLCKFYEKLGFKRIDGTLPPRLVFKNPKRTN